MEHPSKCAEGHQQSNALPTQRHQQHFWCFAIFFFSIQLAALSILSLYFFDFRVCLDFLLIQVVQLLFILAVFYTSPQLFCPFRSLPRLYLPLNALFPSFSSIHFFLVSYFAFALVPSFLAHRFISVLGGASVSMSTCLFLCAVAMFWTICPSYKSLLAFRLFFRICCNFLLPEESKNSCFSAIKDDSVWRSISFHTSLIHRDRHRCVCLAVRTNIRKVRVWVLTNHKSKIIENNFF